MNTSKNSIFKQRPASNKPRNLHGNAIIAWVSICLISITCLSSQPVLAQPQASITLDPAYSLLYPTCANLYMIMINNITDLYGFDLRISFDPTILQVLDLDASQAGTQILQGDFLENGFLILGTVDNTKGTIRYATTQIRPQTPKSGSGVLLKILFSPVSTGVSAINFNHPQFATNQGILIPVQTEAGMIEVTQPGPGTTCPTTPTPTAPTPTITATVQNTPTFLPSLTTVFQTPSPTKTPLPTNTSNPIQMTQTRIVALTKEAEYLFIQITKTSVALTVQYPTQVAFRKTQTSIQQATQTSVALTAEIRATTFATLTTATPTQDSKFFDTPTPECGCSTSDTTPPEVSSVARVIVTVADTLPKLQIWLYICPAALLLLIIILMVFIFSRERADEETNDTEIDYQI